MMDKIKSILIWVVTLGGLLTLLYSFGMKLYLTYRIGKTKKAMKELEKVILKTQEATRIADIKETVYDEELNNYRNMHNMYAKYKRDRNDL